MKAQIIIAFVVLMVFLLGFVILGVRNLMVSTRMAYILSSEVNVTGKIAYKEKPHNHYFLLTEDSYDYYLSGESDKKLKQLEGKQVRISGMSASRVVKLQEQILTYQELVIKSMRLVAGNKGR